MSSELAKLFGKQFLVGYLTPLIVIIAVHYLNHAFVRTWVDSVILPLTVDTIATASLIAVVISIVLLAVNMTFIRLAEGYYAESLLTPFRNIQLDRFDRLAISIARFRENAKKGEPSSGAVAQYSKNIEALSTDFPSLREHVLAFKLGNIIRSFESYSGTKYGVDAIPGWSRLEMVAKTEDLQAVSDARTQFDFFFNLHFLGTASALALLTTTDLRSWQIVWDLVILFIFGWPVRWAMHQAARNWGSYVKACFDVNVPKIQEMMDAAMKVTPEKGIATSQWWLFR
ncbi:hypothetical protein [Devosia sp.]|uniref:hypothetical protein n=1 Tax=Devosia sp. TaxID=1871048 RepID=UPI003BADAA51